MTNILRDGSECMDAIEESKRDSSTIADSRSAFRTKQISKPYFREWTNMQYSKGKTFISNSRLFKADKALYFPNFYGTTIASPQEPQNTSPILYDKISIVAIFAQQWALNQAKTFVNNNENPGLQQAIDEGKDLVQKVQINVEDNWARAMLARFFMSRMRNSMPPDQHDKYFLVRKGLTEEIMDSIGMANGKVGYVYLLDEECRIRWAGSGPAMEEEKESLNKSIRRLIEHSRENAQSKKPTSKPGAAAKANSPRAAKAA